ncbi:hypothetical protein [Variovorax boronicumulans]
MHDTIGAGARRLFANLTLLSLSLVVAGCGTMRPNEGAPATAAKNTIGGTRVAFMNKCTRANEVEYKNAITTAGGKEAGFLLQLATALVPSVLNKLVDFAGAYAEKVGKEYSATATGGTSASLVDGAIRGCIIYVKGSFGNTKAAAADDGWTAAQLDEFGLAHRPDVYAEFVLHSVDGDGKYAAITPVFLDFSTPHAKRTSGAGTKDLAFVIELGAPSNTVATTAGAAPAGIPAPPPAKPADGSPAAKPATNAKIDANPPSKDSTGKSSTLAVYPVSFGVVPVGATFELRALKGLRTQSQQLERSNRNLNVQVTAIETENGGDFLLKLASFLEENQKTIVDTAQPWVLQLLGAGGAKVEKK